MKLSPWVRGMRGLTSAIDLARVLHRRARDIHRGAERAVAVRVRRRDLDEGDIHRQRAVRGEQRGHIREEDGGVAGASRVRRLARVLADEERPQAEVARPARDRYTA